VRLRVAQGNRFTFSVEPAERSWFQHILQLYPVQQTPLAPISEDAGANELLEKSLEDARQKLRDEAAMFLKSGSLEIDAAFTESWNLILTGEQVEELLQILNNVRVGIWIQLGKPEAMSEAAFLATQSEENIRKHMIMHVCAAWQGVLMEAVDSPAEPTQ
jgi:hypothetical protein